MGTLALVWAGFLTGLLLVAAGGKSLRRAGWRDLVAMIAGSGPRARFLTVGLPVAEVAVAAVLVVRPRPGLVLATLLFGGMAVAVQLLRSRLEGVRCSCFGELAPGRLDAGLVRRNAVLAVLAAGAAAGGWLAPAGPSQRPASLLAGLVATAAFLAALRGRDVWRRRPVVTGARVRFAGAPQKRPIALVAVSAGCGACERLVAALPDIAASHPEVELAVAVAPSPGAAALREQLGPLARDDAWRRLARYRQVPGTPYVVAVDASRRVLAASGTSEPALRALLADLGNGATAPALSRSQLFRAAAAGVAVSFAVLPATPALARVARRATDWTVKHDDRNDIDGNCGKFQIALHKGVYDWRGKRLHDTAGYTYAEGFETGDDCSPPPQGERLPTKASVDAHRVTYEWRGHCPCPQHLQYYTDPAVCAADCPSGLACFGYQCVTDFEQYCVEVLFSIKATRKPEIIITALDWTPPASSSARCKVYAKSYSDHVVRHEEQHAKDVLDVIDQWEKRHDRQYVRRCAPTREEAEAAVQAEIAKALDASYPELVQMDCTRNAAYHQSPTGGGASPRCEMCE